MKKLILAVLLVLLPSLVWGAAAVMYVSDSGSNTSPYETWAKAMNEASFETDLEGSAEAGDIYYVLGGSTLTLDSSYDSNLKDGTAVAPISIIGVKAATTAEPPTYTDWPAVGSADRPTFDCVADYNIIFGDYYKVFNAIFTGTHTGDLVTVGASDIIFNCKFDQGTVTANQSALLTGTRGKAIACEFISDAGYGAEVGSYSSALYCYFHDSVVGVLTDSGFVSAFSVYDTMSLWGAYVSNKLGCVFLNNTFYSCVSGVYGTTGYATVAINNIIDTSTDGFIWTTQTDTSFFWQNHEGNTVTDMWDLVEETDVAHKDNAVTSGDPKFTGAAAGNFTLGSTSPNLDAALGLELGDE